MMSDEVEIIFENIRSSEILVSGADHVKKFVPENGKRIEYEASKCMEKRNKIISKDTTSLKQKKLTYKCVKRISNASSNNEDNGSSDVKDVSFCDNVDRQAREFTRSSESCLSKTTQEGIGVASTHQNAIDLQMTDNNSELLAKPSGCESVRLISECNISRDNASFIVAGEKKCECESNTPVKSCPSSNNTSKCKVISPFRSSKDQLDESSSPEKKIKFSPQLRKRGNKFSINGSPASSSKNKIVHSGSKFTPKSRSPHLALSAAGSCKKTPVKRKLNFNETFFETPDSRKGKIPEDGSSLNKTKQLNNKIIGDGYIYRNFKLHIDEVLADSSIQDLISEDEKNLIFSFLDMDPEIQDLYARMHNRKHKWNRLEDIRYISATIENIQILVDRGFVTIDTKNASLETLLNLIKCSEVKTFCKSLHIKYSSRNKKDIVNEILRYCQQQKTISSMLRGDSSEDVMKKEIKKIIGTCFCLTPEFRDLFRRIHLLFNLKFTRSEQTRFGSQDLFEIQFAGTDPVMYPNIDNVIHKEAKIFSSRQELLRFQKAENFKETFFTALRNKSWQEAEEIISAARDNFFGELSCSIDSDDSRSSFSARHVPLSIRKFSPGTVYAYILFEGIEVLKRLKKRSTAIGDLIFLLDQTLYLPYMRSRWYEQLVSIYLQERQIKQAIETICTALKDSYLDDQGRYILSCQCKKLLKRKKGITNEEKSKLKDIPMYDLKNVEIEEIRAKALEGKAGYKRVYVQDDTGDGKTYSSVEELVINHYVPRYYKCGVHAENSIIVSLFGILFWDVIYECYVPYAFISKYHTKPLDLSTGEFYQNRQSIIDQKLIAMRNWTNDEIATWVSDIFDKHCGRLSVVHWKWFQSSKNALDMITCIGMDILLNICERIAKSYRVVRSGFPDLFLWTPGQEKQYKFVEVKGPNDTLRPNQKLWLDFLEKNKVNVEVCLVKAHGSNLEKRKATVQPEIDDEDYSTEDGL